MIERARHVEVQILGDGEHVIHLFERECSVQRRRQKVWEEAPSPALPGDVRDALCRSAVALAKAVNYRGAGTLEYLYDDATRAFYFIEMNTRIQVEHPVTEMVTASTIVREQIRVCLGEKLRFGQADIPAQRPRHRGPAQRRGPPRASSRIGNHRDAPRAGGPGVRFDSLLYSGYTVPPFYDSLLGKLIVWDEDRKSAITRLERALASSRSAACRRPGAAPGALPGTRRAAAGFDTTWLERWLSTMLDYWCRNDRLDSGGGRLMRYSFGGDEHLFVEVDESMSLEPSSRPSSSPTRSGTRAIDGVTEICPANASFQIKFDPDRISPDDMLAELKAWRPRSREVRLR